MENNAEVANEFHTFIQNAEAKNTKYGTTTAFNAFRRYLDSVDEQRDILTLAPDILNNLLGSFFIHGTKKDGSVFEPDSLSTIHRGIQRYLDTKKYGFNILHNEIFQTSRQVLAAKRKTLTQQGRGNKPCATRELDPTEVDTLFREKYFGADNPASLTNVIWWLTSLHFGFRARNEARKLTWGDIVLAYDENEKQEYLEWGVERGTKTRKGLENEVKRAYAPRVYATNDERCPIMLYKQYKLRRPVESCALDSPFFLTIDQKVKVDPKKDGVWFRNQAMGKNKIGSVLTNARKMFGIPGRKVANHSVRKTSIGRLLDANLAETFVVQHAGMKSLDSLKAYKCANKSQIHEMSAILSNENTVSGPGTSNDSNVLEYVEITEDQENTNIISNSQSNRNSSKVELFSGNAFRNCSNCTFNISIAGPLSSPMKRKRLDIEEEEE